MSTRYLDFAEAKRFALDLLQLMKRNVERDGHLAPVAFVIATHDPETGRPLDGPRTILLALDFSTALAKEESVLEVRDAAKRSQALMVLTGAQCSTAMVGPSVPAGERSEAILLMLEHRRGHCSWLAPITWRAPRRPSVGEAELLDGEPLGGDFGDFLPRIPGGTALH